MNVLDLTSDLVRLDTAGANESRAADVVVPILLDAGFMVETFDLSPRRSTVWASWKGGGDLVLSGHLDTVSVDPQGWERSPLEPWVLEDRLYGRGSSDMKGGVASMVLAAADHVQRTPMSRGFSVALTCSEESGCQGAQVLARTGLLPSNPILIIGESTSNDVRLGHKGATWLEVTVEGTAAHGSRPDLGVNAIDTLLQAAGNFAKMAPDASHPYLGAVTTNIGTIWGGTQTNMVAAHAGLTLDVRTVPGTDLDTFEASVLNTLDRGNITRLLDLAPIWTDENEDTALRVVEIVSSVTGRASGPPSGTAYFTDAAALAPVANPRVFIVGPGDPGQPHTANENCSITRLDESFDVYSALLDAWHLGQLS